ncbi:MAG: hypothetical protein Q8P12_02945 [bacterium]|nr:hypothetical protein [bacterium]
MAFKVSIIGPTNLGALGRRLQKPQELLLDWAAFVGRTLAEHGCELLTNAGEGMLSAVPAAYKEHGGPLWTVVLPERPHRWPNYHVLPYGDKADEVRWEPTWDDANYAMVSVPSLCICMGLSSGTDREISDAVWDVRFPSPRVNLQKLVAIPDLLVGGRLHPEHEEDILPKLVYLKGREDLSRIIEELRQ